MNAYNPTTDRQRELINHLADNYEQLRESRRIRKLIEEKGVRGLSAQEFEDYKALIHRGVEGDLMRLREFGKASRPGRANTAPSGAAILRSPASEKIPLLSEPAIINA